MIMSANLSYGLHLDRDYFMHIAVSIQTVMPIISSLTIYPMNFYLLSVALPKMMVEIRAAYLANLVTHIFFDWMWNFSLRACAIPPYSLFYCEGPLCRMGLDKQTVMTLPVPGLTCVHHQAWLSKDTCKNGLIVEASSPLLQTFLAIAVMCCIPTYYFLMMHMHQMVVNNSSRWKLSKKLQLSIHVSLLIVSVTNVVGFVIFTKDVENYDELVEKPELRWLVKRGGQLILFGEPGQQSSFINEIIFFGASFAIFLPLLLLFTFYALYILKRNAARSKSNKTQTMNRKVFDAFFFQLRGAIIFFISPLLFALIAGIIDTRNVFSDNVYAALRFGAHVLFSLNPSQFALVFILRNSTHRKILMKRAKQFRIFFVVLEF